MHRLRRYSGAAVALTCALAGLAVADLQTSKHNLSTSGPGTIKAATESQTCVFCHTPHNASPAVPLWNHATSVSVYSTYTSSTLEATAPLGQPTGASKLCLSCHDGTIALGQTVNDGSITLLGTGPGGRMPSGSSNLGTDLRDDHPISFQRNPSSLEVVDPPPGDAVRLDSGGLVQCTSCHDAHKEDLDTVVKRFLVKNNSASGICVTCHRPTYWSTNPSSHQSSTKTYTAARGAHTGYTTVRENGCESCHRPHTGNTPARLLKFVEEQTCDKCHDGSVAAKNITADFQKAYNHPTYDTTPSVHDAAESPSNLSNPLPETSPAAPRHAECADCHNPHASYARTATAPGVSGALSGVSGIDSGGAAKRPATAAYEICYKCHADSQNKPQPNGLPDPPYIRREIVQFNVREEFDPLNPSHHAVEAAGRNNDVPSLIAPYTTASVIYCTDCHNSNTSPAGGGTGPNGPHGSIYPHLLARRLTDGAGNGGDPNTLYALCFRCHSSSSILSDVTFKEHDKHIRGEGTSCTVCHDPHGISAAQGNSTNNSHLINFDRSVVSPNSQGELFFQDRGSRAGSCSLSCHGKDHRDERYP